MITLKAVGIEDVKSALENMLGRHVKPLLNATMYGVGTEIKEQFANLVPKRKKILSRSFQVKRSKPIKGVSPVKVGVKPRGYYWRFIDQGHKKRGGRVMSRPFKDRGIANVTGDLDGVIGRRFSRALERRMKSELKRQR